MEVTNRFPYIPYPRYLATASTIERTPGFAMGTFLCECLLTPSHILSISALSEPLHPIQPQAQCGNGLASPCLPRGDDDDGDQPVITAAAAAAAAADCTSRFNCQAFTAESDIPIWLVTLATMITSCDTN
ncbi:hypothetical protein PoB_007034900 [Plakobranchus ocellatus]|uniref:Uncharacterized protein n=1 Tax=Plakobranchus ocellatus TaxID=259542 RepID=A0AAV4DIJ2_9GAST|nr:hypothetical protein PoB_007034900 [Plakobranchus ocellatus]